MLLNSIREKILVTIVRNSEPVSGIVFAIFFRSSQLFRKIILIKITNKTLFLSKNFPYNCDDRSTLPG